MAGLRLALVADMYLCFFDDNARSSMSDMFIPIGYA